jgi:hypothetical protein
MLSFLRKKFLIKVHYKEKTNYIDRGFVIQILPFKSCFETKINSFLKNKLFAYFKNRIVIKDLSMLKVNIDRMKGDIYPVEVFVEKNDKPMDLTGWNAKIFVKKGDNILENDGECKDSTVYVAPNADMVNEPGTFPFKIKIFKDNETITILYGNLNVYEDF